MSKTKAKVEAYTETCMSNKKKKKLMLRHACLKQQQMKKHEVDTETCMSNKTQNDHIYKNGHNWDRKLVSRHDSGGIRK